MCGVSAVAIAALAISAAATAASQIQKYQAQKQAAHDAAKAQQARHEYDKKVAENQYAAYRDAANRLNLRDSQQREAAAHDAFNAKLQNLKQREHARAASSNISGISVDALLGDYNFVGAQGQNAITANLNANLEQNAANKRSAFTPVQSAYLQANRKQRIIRGPSPMALGLGLVKTGANAVASYYTGGFSSLGSGGGGGGVTAEQAQQFGTSAGVDNYS